MQRIGDEFLAQLPSTGMQGLPVKPLGRMAYSVSSWSGLMPEATPWLQVGWGSVVQQHLPLAPSAWQETLGTCPRQELWHTGEMGNQAAGKVQARVQVQSWLSVAISEPLGFHTIEIKADNFKFYHVV